MANLLQESAQADTAETTPAPEAKKAPYQGDPRVVNGSVLFGRYEQDHQPDNGAEAIEWVVWKYDEARNRALLVSRYGLDTHPFDTDAYYGWAPSEMRRWLNNDFWNTAFSADEQSLIETTTIVTHDNRLWRQYWEQSEYVDGGSTCEDKLFLLSLEEVLEHCGVKTIGAQWKPRAQMRLLSTAEATAHGAYLSDQADAEHQIDGSACTWWWLRSPGGSSVGASFVYADGSLGRKRVSDTNICVRPALWLRLGTP